MTIEAFYARRLRDNHQKLATGLTLIALVRQMSDDCETLIIGSKQQHKCGGFPANQKNADLQKNTLQLDQKLHQPCEHRALKRNATDTVNDTRSYLFLNISRMYFYTSILYFYMSIERHTKIIKKTKY